MKASSREAVFFFLSFLSLQPVHVSSLSNTICVRQIWVWGGCQKGCTIHHTQLGNLMKARPSWKLCKPSEPVMKAWAWTKARQPAVFDPTPGWPWCLMPVLASRSPKVTNVTNVCWWPGRRVFRLVQQVPTFLSAMFTSPTGRHHLSAFTAALQNPKRKIVL